MMRDRYRRTDCSRVSLPSIVLVMLHVMALSACKPDLTTPPERDLHTMFWSLTLNHHAVLLSTSAPSDTVQLIATARNVYGEALENMPAVVYKTVDTTIRLSETGLVRASSATTATGARVIATLSNGLITQVDTVFIQVRKTTTPPSLPGTFKLRRTDTDSTKTAIGGVYIPIADDTLGIRSSTYRTMNPSFAFSVVAHNGDTIKGVSYFSTSDNTIVTINRATGAITMLRPGQVVLTATSYVYGVELRDTLRFTVSPPLSALIAVCGGCPGSLSLSVRIGVGGVVTWTNYMVDSSAVNVEFEEPLAASGILYGTTVFGGGNITGLGISRYARRRFHAAGVYPFRVSTNPIQSGVVVVVTN